MLENAHNVRHQRNWDTLYVVVDIHGTVMKPNWEGLSTEFYPHALDVLRHLSKDPLYKMIMWTCSKEEDRAHYKELFAEEGVHFDYINENPEVIGKLNWGDYDTKMYANIGMDDKFSFDPEKDWIEFKRYFGLPVKGTKFQLNGSLKLIMKADTGYKSEETRRISAHQWKQITEILNQKPCVNQ